MHANNINTSTRSGMWTTDVIVTIYQAHKPGVPGDYGPSGLASYYGVAGVSSLNCRPEFFGVERNLSEENKGLCIEKEVDGLGQPPCKKLVKIHLPAHVYCGDFKFAGLSMSGLHSDFSATDGMGPCVGVWCRESVVFQGGDYEKAIDKAIRSGIVLYVPTWDGKREEISVKILSVSDIF